ncbi:MAG TPA: diaminopimelate epimerase [Bryobacteraceae bacterium]|nr:diaminopimelate epimerase [Bryobacteraceae bacterium]
MKIPFTKAHGAKNDFLLTWRRDAPEQGYPAIARAICDRYTGIGADGWMLVDPPHDANAEGAIELYNSDGSAPELSGNGTRCAAAFLIEHGFAPSRVRIRTGAGIKTLRLLDRQGLTFNFEMNMGKPRVVALQFALPLSSGPRDVTLVDVGNPQCAVPVDSFDFDWRSMGAEIERHPHFPKRTNVSFIQPADAHTIAVRFFERGAGETNSSGTGSTGAAAAAVARGVVQSPVRVLTPAGPLEIRIQDEAFLTGPAVIIGAGEFFFDT